MRHIYSNAESVIAWIGGMYQPAPHVQRKVFEVLRTKQPRVHFNELCAHVSERSKTISAFYYAIIFDEFWQRTWILQEMLLAKTIQVVTGNNMFSWEDLKAALDHMHRKIGGARATEVQAVENIQKLFHLREALTRGHKIKLIQALNATTLQLATDPRDKIYGLLGITSDGPTIVPMPDYGVSLDDLLEKVQRRIVLSEPSLDVLASKLTWHGIDQWRISWCPEWKSLWQTRTLRWSEICYESAIATATRYSDHSFEIVDDVAINYGVEVDTVDQMNSYELLTQKNIIQISHPESKPTVYQSSQAVFTAINACLFLASAKSDDWLYLAALFATESNRMAQCFGPNVDLITKWWLRECQTLVVSGITLKDWAQQAVIAGELSQLEISEIMRYIKLLSEIPRWRDTLVVTTMGYVGTIHPSAKSGDKICLLRAFRNIVILSPWKDGFKIVGYAHIDGMMNGEMMGRVEDERAQKFILY